MGLERFWHVVQQFRLLSLKDPAMTDKAEPIQPSFCCLAHPAVHGVVCVSFECCCLG